MESIGCVALREEFNELKDRVEYQAGHIDRLLKRITQLEKTVAAAAPPAGLTPRELTLELRITDATQRLMKAINAEGPCSLESIVGEVRERLVQLGEKGWQP